MSNDAFNDNPFRDLPQPNPYAAPSGMHDMNGVRNPLLVPAICLLVFALVFLGLLVLSTPIQIAQFTKDFDLTTPEGVGRLVGGVVALVGWVITMIVIAVGAIGMLRLQGYGMAVTAAVLSVIPCCSPCYVCGIPFGIWALIVLRRPDVRCRFR